MPEDCGCSKANASQDSLSRREFIRATGIVAAGASLAAAPIRLRQPPMVLLSPVDPDVLKVGLVIALADANYQEARKNIMALGLTLDETTGGVKFADVSGSLLGFVLSQALSPSKRMGVDIALTVDFNTGILTSVHVLTGWSLVDLLNISNVTYDHRDQTTTINGNNKNGPFSILVRPKTELYWSFPYQQAPPFLPIDLVESGWPPHAEDPNAGYWHYGNGVKAEWLMDRGEAVYRVTQVKETNVNYGDLYTQMSFAVTQGG